MSLKRSSSALLRTLQRLNLRKFRKDVQKGASVLADSQRGAATAASVAQKNDQQTSSEVSASKIQTCKHCNATVVSENRKPSVFPSHLTASAFGDLLSQIDAFIFDADGVLWLGNVVIPGSPQFIDYLVAQGKRVIILSNNSSRSRKYLGDRMRKLGFSSISEENLVIPAIIVADLLKAKGLTKSAYLIGSEGLLEELQEAGIDCFGSGPDATMSDDEFDDDMFKDKDGFLYQNRFHDDVGAVVVGFEKHFSYVKLIRAANYLKNNNCFFVGTNEDETTPGPDADVVIPDTGPILAAIKSATGREPIVVGKPNTAAFDYISKRWNLSPERTMMVGDRLTTDIAFGKKNGLKTMLVLTGSHGLPDVTSHWNDGNGSLLPDFYATSLGDLLPSESLCKAKKSL